MIKRIFLGSALALMLGAALFSPTTSLADTPQTLSMSSTNNCVSPTTPQGVTGIQISGGTWTGAMVVQASADAVNYSNVYAVNASTGNTSQNISANGLYRASASGLQNIRVCVSTTGSNSATVGFFTYPASGVVSVDNPLTAVVANPTAFPTPIPWSNTSPEPGKLVVPTPAPTTFSATATPAPSTYSYTFDAGSRSYTQVSCDLEGFSGGTVITAYRAIDAANALPQLAPGQYLQSQSYSSALSNNGQYVFPLYGAKYLDFSVTTTGSGSITISCAPRYSGDTPRQLDGAGNQSVTLAGQTQTIAVTTPAPVITSSPGNQVTTQEYCPTTVQTVTANGGTTYSCTMTLAGSKNVAVTNAPGVYTARDSVNTGLPDASGVYADNPSNAACNTSTSGIWCGVTLTGTTITTLVTGVTGKKIYLLGMVATNTSGSNVTLQFYEGNSGNCSGSQVLVGVPILVPAGAGVVMPQSFNPWFQTATTDGLCVALSAAASSVNINATMSQF